MPMMSRRRCNSLAMVMSFLSMNPFRRPVPGHRGACLPTDYSKSRRGNLPPLGRHNRRAIMSCPSLAGPRDHRIGSGVSRLDGENFLFLVLAHLIDARYELISQLLRLRETLA